jgi:hypothetical protein
MRSDKIRVREIGAKVGCAVLSAPRTGNTSRLFHCAVRTRRPTLAVVLSALFACIAFAQPKLTSISPQWIQRGATIDVTLAGDRLNSVTGFVFSGEAGLSATLPPPPAATKPTVEIESGSGAFTVAPPAKPENPKSLVVRLTAMTNATLGARELRVVGPTGISEPLTINVGPLPELAETEPNNIIEQAQNITLPTTVNGVISAATEVDSFKFKAKQGETIILDVDAAQRGSQLDSSLAVLDAKGKALARNEDANGFDSLLAFTAPETGEYIAQLRDFEYRGGGNYTYRLHIGALPYVQRAFPFGGQRGKPVELTLTGKNISGGEKMTLNIAPDAPLGRQELRLKLPQGFANPIAFDVRDVPEMFEAATNATNTVTIPTTINGRIESPRDIDYFAFKADADRKVVAEVIASRFGSPLDALLLVYANGALVTQNDDASGADARVEIDAKKGIEYVLAVRDLNDRDGDEFGYRLSVRSAEPSFVVKFFPDVLRVHRGGLTKVRCEVQRTGFDGAIEVKPENFPAGTIVGPLTIPAGSASATLIVAASSAAAVGSTPIQFTATARLDGKNMAQPAVPLIVTDKTERAVKQGFISVLERAPFAIEPVTLSAVLDQDQGTNIEYRVVRQGDFTGDVVVWLDGFSLGRDPITKNFEVKPATVKATETAAKLMLKVKSDSEIGTRHVFARAEWVVNGETNAQFSAPIPATVKQIPFVLSVVTPRVFLTLPRAGSTSAVEEVTVKLSAKRQGYDGEIPLTLEGMPEGVTVADAKVPAGAGEAAIRLKPTAKAKPGTNYNFTARGVATHEDRIYRHKSGAVKLFIEAPATEVAAATNAPATAPSK